MNNSPALSVRAQRAAFLIFWKVKRPCSIARTSVSKLSSSSTISAASLATSLADSKPLRRAALLQKIPYYTTLSGAIAAVAGIKAYSAGDLEVRALQDYFA